MRERLNRRFYFFVRAPGLEKEMTAEQAADMDRACAEIVVASKNREKKCSGI